MENCERCNNNKYFIFRLQDEISSLKEQLRTEQNKTSDYDSVKRDRDRLQKNVDRAYDNYVTTPKGMP